MNNRRNAAFTVELLGLFILLTAVITIVTGVFVMTRAHSLQAKQLTEAVILAENAAEVSSAAPDSGRLAGMLSGLDNSDGDSFILSENGDSATVAVYASMKAETSAGENVYLITVAREYPDGLPAERSDGGTYARDTISVFEAAGSRAEGSADPESLGEPVYTLTAGTYFGPEDIEEGGRP